MFFWWLLPEGLVGVTAAPEAPAVAAATGAFRIIMMSPADAFFCRWRRRRGTEQKAEG